MYSTHAPDIYFNQGIWKDSYATVNIVMPNRIWDTRQGYYLRIIGAKYINLLKILLFSGFIFGSLQDYF